MKKVDREKNTNDHDGTRTHNLPLRRRAPYPLGHAVILSTCCVRDLMKASGT